MYNIVLLVSDYFDMFLYLSFRDIYFRSVKLLPLLSEKLFTTSLLIYVYTFSLISTHKIL